MTTIKKYGFVLVVIPALILVIIRLSGSLSFKPDAQRWIEPSLYEKNIISDNQVDDLVGNKLFVVQSDVMTDVTELMHTERINFDTVLNKQSIRTIHKHEGPIIVFTKDLSISARIWMFLSQLGYENVFIMSDDDENEVFKENYRAS